MESYSIKKIEQLTGIKAHTIRIWEKRYNTLLPHRTPTGIRYYDNDQLRRILNISVLLQQGNKISALMRLPDEKINDMILRQVSQPQPGDFSQIYINSLVSSMLSFDELLFEKVFSTIFIRLGVYDAMVNVVYPFLKTTGIFWSTGNASPAQEHFASNIVKRKLLVALDAIPVPKHSPKKFLLFLPPGEWHDIGLHFSDYVIRNAGVETINLGQSVPYTSIHSCVQKVSPDHLLTFFNSGTDVTEAMIYLKELAICNPLKSILIISNIPYNYGTLPTNITFLGDPKNIFDYLH